MPLCGLHRRTSVTIGAPERLFRPALAAKQAAEFDHSPLPQRFPPLVMLVAQARSSRAVGIRTIRSTSA